VYQIIAWLGWIPNLLLVEWMIRKKYLNLKWIKWKILLSPFYQS
jgi:hypothetical protein